MKNKWRLYLAIYEKPRLDGLEPGYHWTLILGPKQECADKVKGSICVRYHVTDHIGTKKVPWFFDSTPTASGRDSSVICRLQLGKVHPDKVKDLEDTIRDERRIRSSEVDWSCCVWTKEAVQGIENAGILKHDNIQSIDVDELEIVAKRFADAIMKYGLKKGNGIPLTKMYSKDSMYMPMPMPP